MTEKMAHEERKVSQSSIGYSRTVEKAFEASEYCGELDLCGQKLKELPDFAKSYELSNLISVGTTVSSLLK